MLYPVVIVVETGTAQISTLIDEQIAFEGRLLVIGGNARLETAVGGLDVAVAMVNADDDGIGVVH